MSDPLAKCTSRQRNLLATILAKQKDIMKTAQLLQDEGVPVVFFCKSTGSLEFYAQSIEVHLDPDGKVPKVRYVKPIDVLRY